MIVGRDLKAGNGGIIGKQKKSNLVKALLVANVFGSRVTGRVRECVHVMRFPKRFLPLNMFLVALIFFAEVGVLDIMRKPYSPIQRCILVHILHLKCRLCSRITFFVFYLFIRGAMGNIQSYSNSRSNRILVQIQNIIAKYQFQWEFEFIWIKTERS